MVEVDFFDWVLEVPGGESFVRTLARRVAYIHKTLKQDWENSHPLDLSDEGLFAELKSETRPRHLVRLMSGGQRQAVAIARTRLSNPKIVLMDEPTAAISVRQVAEVLDLIRRLRDSGVSVVLISHRMPDVFAVCDRVIVMRRGEKRADKPIGDTSPEEVTALITGAKEAA